jgi:AcrR family transcriptional regulator
VRLDNNRQKGAFVVYTTEEQKMSRQLREDPRIVRTRQLIVKAFQELLSEKPFEALTIQEIADRATVNRVTFYAHFADKYVLLDVAFQASFQSELRAHLPSDAALSLTNLHLLIQMVCEFLTHAYTHCAPSGRAHIEAGIGRHLQQELYDFLLAWLIPFESVQSIAELRATIASWAIYGVAKRWSEGKRNESVQDFVQQALPMIAPGFGVDADSAKKADRLARAIVE